jgi:hypothetical protein
MRNVTARKSSKGFKKKICQICSGQEIRETASAQSAIGKGLFSQNY